MQPQLTETIKDEDQLEQRLLELSKDNRAWTFIVRPFSHEVMFYAAASPSKLPDWLINQSRLGKLHTNCVAWHGKMVPFSKAALIREQNRNTGCQ